MQVLKTLKRVAAIGTGVAMLGATLTGALALDLKDYPKPFVVDGVYDDSNVFVYGDTAIAADTVAISDITAGLQFLAKTPVVTSGSTVSVTGGKAQQVPLGQGFSNSTYFDRQLQDDDVSTLFDGTINYQGSDYDTSEELQMCDVNGGKYDEPYVATSLMLPDDDYKSNVYFTFGKDKIKYAYKFDETINLSKATTTNPLEIDFLGKKLKITSVTAAGDEFTATVGDEYSMKEGDSVTVEGKTITLNAVGTTATVDVDGTVRNLAEDTTTTVNGIEIYLDSVMSKTNLGDSSAILVMGKQATETYSDGEAFIGEDEDNPNWVWDIVGIHKAGISDTNGDCETTDGTTNNVLRVENDFEMNDLTDKPTEAGQCIDLPNKYLSLCFDSLTVVDTDYIDFNMDFGTNEALDDANCVSGSGATSTADAIYMSTTATEGFDLRTFTTAPITEIANVTSNVKAKEVWLFASPTTCNGTAMSVGTTTWLNVFYKSTDSPQRVRWFGAINTSASTAGSAGTKLARINYGDTKDTNMVLYLKNNVGTTSNALNLTWVVTADTTTDIQGSSEEIVSSWGMASGNLTALGAVSSGDAEATELQWVPAGRFSASYLGTKDEDHRTSYGIVIKNPDTNSGSDKVVLSIPNDQVFANIVVKGSAATVTSGSTSYVPTKVSPVNMAASAVTSPTSFNLIVVGGPCANPLAESVFGQTCDGWAYQEGEALVKLVANGEKVAMLVAGTSALDTQRAGKAVANYDKYAFSGAEVLVKGATMTDITVVPPTVAAPVVAAEEVVA
ncbi:MAG: hypothetical protein WC852_00595 [Candidatus Nanoarchaeia archaeon]|jgi:hypothetical protein